MSDQDDSVCPLHLSKRNPDGKCTWCEAAAGKWPTKPYALTENDRKFLRGLKIDPEAD